MTLSPIKISQHFGPSPPSTILKISLFVRVRSLIKTYGQRKAILILVMLLMRSSNVLMQSIFSEKISNPHGRTLSMLKVLVFSFKLIKIQQIHKKSTNGQCFIFWVNHKRIMNKLTEFDLFLQSQMPLQTFITESRFGYVSDNAICRK